MNPLTGRKPPKNSNRPCSDLTTMAERELSALLNAVTQLFGSGQAELSAEDWLHEVIETDALPASVREWRSITTKVLSRLASRVTVSSQSSSLSSEPQIA
jgi:hypothetical protein